MAWTVPNQAFLSVVDALRVVPVIRSKDIHMDSGPPYSDLRMRILGQIDLGARWHRPCRWGGADNSVAGLYECWLLRLIILHAIYSTCGSREVPEFREPPINMGSYSLEGRSQAPTLPDQIWLPRTHIGQLVAGLRLCEQMTHDNGP